MEFCEKCGGMIMLQNGEGRCISCNHKSKKKLKIKTSEKMQDKETIAIVEEEEEINPIIEMKCTKCKNKKCYFWTQQTRSSDESETKFYKCTECKHSWRVYR